MSDSSEIKPTIAASSPGEPPFVPPLFSPAVPPLPSLPSQQNVAVASTPPQSQKAKKGLAGALGAIGIMIAKWWGVVLAVLLKFKTLLVALKLFTAFKLILTGGSMLLSIFLYSFAFGWPMAVGLVMMIFVHESGHALAAVKLGRKVGMMIFLPFMGAFVTTQGNRNAVEDAFVGIMGPVFGTLFGLGSLAVYYSTHSLFWLALSELCFMLNLFNLAPSPPLDGGWISPLFSPKLLLPGVIFLAIGFWRNPAIWVLLIMSVPRIMFAWKEGTKSEYYRATAKDRWVYGISYLGLAALLATLSLWALTVLREGRHIH